MKRIAYLWLAIAIAASMAVGMANAQQSDSLGDYARSVRKGKKQDVAVKKFDNDNLPHNDNVSVVGNAPQSDKQAQDSPKPDNSADPTKKADSKASQSAADKQKEYSDWKDKLGAQKSQVDLLSRELDVLQREYRLRAATFYADAGNRLRNSGDWDKEDSQYKQKIADKQKSLDDAKAKLDDMQEEARKAGVPAGLRE